MEHPDAEKRRDADRDETEAERLDRNWSSLLQELRVTQTGVQLLTGFLLTLPFQPRFAQLGSMSSSRSHTVAPSRASSCSALPLPASQSSYSTRSSGRRAPGLQAAAHWCLLLRSGSLYLFHCDAEATAPTRVCEALTGGTPVPC